VFAHTNASAIFARALDLPMLAKAFPATFFASVLLLHMHAKQLATAIFTLIPPLTVLTNTNTAA
jgi:hypothetical protein